MSHETSVASGISEQAQIRACKDYYSEHCVHTGDKKIGKAHFPSDTPAGVFVDRGEAKKGQSAWKKGFWGLDQRPAGRELVKCLKPGDHIVCYNVERLARNAENCLRMLREFEEKGISVHFASERFEYNTASGKFMLTVMAAAAQYQSDIKSERTREALRIKKMFGGGGNKKKERSEWLDSSMPIKRRTTERVENRNFTVHIYNRVSSHDQKLSQLGMDVQRGGNLHKANLIAATGDSVKIETYEDESVSAFSVNFSKRPAASKMLAALKPGDHVVFYRGDRAFRNTRQCCEFVELCIKNGITVHLTREGISTADEHGRMFFKILAVFAEIESETKRTQKLAINEYMAARGRPISRYPRQFKAKKINGRKQLVYNEKELAEMSRAWLLRKLGHKWDQVCRILQAYYCQAKRIKPGLVCEIEDTKTRRQVKRFEEIMPNLGPEVTSALVADAIAYLATEVDAAYLSWCKHPLPILCTLDQIASAGICPKVLESLRERLQPEPSPA